MTKHSWRLLAWVFLFVMLMLVPVAALIAGTAGAAVPAGVPTSSFSAAQAESQQQDVFLDRINVPGGTPTTTTNTPTATSTPCYIPNIIQNGGFESGSLAPGWAIVPGAVNPTPTVSSDNSHSGTYSVLLGARYGTEPLGNAAIIQYFTVPPSGGTLSYWYNGNCACGPVNFDWEDAYITDANGTILATIMHTWGYTGGWIHITYNLAPYAGQQIGIEFLVYEDGFGDLTYMYVDDVAVIDPTCTSPTPTYTSAPYTSTPNNTPTRTRTNTPTATGTPTFTETHVATDTPTSTNTPPGIPTGIATSTAVPTSTSISVPPTPTACTIQFSDVSPGSTFYPFVRCLACLGIVSGYPDDTFTPNNNVTRGQLSKIVSNAAGFSDPQPNQMFQDVSVGSTFQVYIGRLAGRGYVSGYPCGGPGEPCVPPTGLPYFRPNANATRGQITKIDANAAGFTTVPAGQQFEDVLVGSTYYTYTYRLVSRGVMGGYPCGGSGEPCVPPANLPYFRPNNNATRGQTTKIVANTFFPNCQTPAPHISGP